MNAMYLDLMDILRAPGTSLERDIDLDPVALDDVRFVERIRGRVKAANARRSIVISGAASSAVEMRCARCLRAFALPLSMDLEASAPTSFFRAAPNAVIQSPRQQRGSEEEGEDEEDVDDETAAIFDAHSVDVLELLRQAAVLNWPIQPLCSADCGGLPEASRYNVSDGDDRWAALRAFATPEAEAEAGEVEAAADGDEDEFEDLTDEEIAEIEKLVDSGEADEPRRN